MSLYVVLCASVCLGASLLLLGYLSRATYKAPYPPGPPGRPLVGNLFDWPFEWGWLKFTEWAKLYGDIVHLQVFNQHVVILNEMNLAQKLMSQGPYSDRPRLIMVGELMCFGPSIILSPYGDHWKAMRRLTRQHLSKTACRAFASSQMEDARLLLRLIMQDPSDFRSYVHYIVGKNIIETSYGLEIDSPDNKYIMLSEKTHEYIQHAVIPGNFLVDFIPALKHVPAWFPGANFQRLAQLACMTGKAMVDDTLAEVKLGLAEGRRNDSLCTKLLQTEPTSGTDHEFTVKWVVGSLYGAGTETVTSSLCTFLLMMTLHPDVQAKAHKELDAVVGTGRLPTLADRDNLPYIEAIVYETLRYHPPVPLGVPHQLSQDDIFAGYHLPKGSIVITNLWGMSRDTRVYGEHTGLFCPERFLDDRQGEMRRRAALAFGVGRRACPGIHYATATLFITILSLLSAFEMSSGEDQDTKEEVLPEFTGAFVSHPTQFPCKFKARNPAAACLVSAR